jgi:hypothetical protein
MSQAPPESSLPPGQLGSHTLETVGSPISVPSISKRNALVVIGGGSFGGSALVCSKGWMGNATTTAVACLFYAATAGAGWLTISAATTGAWCGAIQQRYKSTSTIVQSANSTRPSTFHTATRTTSTQTSQSPQSPLTTRSLGSVVLREQLGCVPGDLTVRVQNINTIWTRPESRASPASGMPRHVTSSQHDSGIGDVSVSPASGPSQSHRNARARARATKACLQVIFRLRSWTSHGVEVPS